MEKYYMKALFDFILQINCLKNYPRTGWVLRKVKNPDTIADHSFRTAFLGWLLAERVNPKISSGKIIKYGIGHDFCEVYAGDITPWFYYNRELPSDEEKQKKFFRRYCRLTQSEKIARAQEQRQIEKESILKLTQNLEPSLKKEIISIWVDYENGLSLEGKFIKQINKIETLLQALKYFGTAPGSYAEAWWEEIEEYVTHPLLHQFLKAIQKKFYQRLANYEKDKELESILDFIIKIGKLKTIPRTYWKLRKINNPETVAGHIFSVSVLAWLLGRERKNLQEAKLLKMALSHEIVAIETGDITPYDRLIMKRKEKAETILNKMIRLTKKEKNKNFQKEFKKEKKALAKLLKKLPPERKKEISDLWEDYKKRQSSEGVFLSQVNTIALLLQGIIYKKENKGFIITPLWELAFESIHDPLLLEFLNHLKEYENS